MAKPLFVFAHGAGAGSQHPFMQDFAARLSRVGRVHTFDYPYLREGRRMPDRLPKLIAAHAQELDSARKRRRGPIVLIGKSMGSRVGCHVSLERSVHGLICLGYPLHGMGDPNKLRDEVLKQLTTPVLFVQGTRDKLCPIDRLERVRKQMRARSELYVVEAGDHSLRVTKRQLKLDGATQGDVDASIVERIGAFCSELKPRR